MRPTFLERLEQWRRAHAWIWLLRTPVGSPTWRQGMLLLNEARADLGRCRVR